MFPSPAALALLVSLWATTVNANEPLTSNVPDFLCPSASSCPHPSSESASDASPSTIGPSGLGEIRHSMKGKRTRPSQSRHIAYRRQNLPTKYSQGADGRWRPDTTWSLHGQTVECSIVSALPTPTAFASLDGHPGGDAIIDSVDDSVAVSESSDFTTDQTSPTSTTTSVPQDLPSGWANPKPRSKFYSVPVIVVFSLALACFIALLIAGCTLLRRKRWKYKDSKRKLKRGSDAEIVEEVGDEEDPTTARRIKKKKKAWARSSARWRLNAHFTLRKRLPIGKSSFMKSKEKTVYDSADSSSSASNEEIHTNISDQTIQSTEASQSPPSKHVRVPDETQLIIQSPPLYGTSNSISSDVSRPQTPLHEADRLRINAREGEWSSCDDKSTPSDTVQQFMNSSDDTSSGETQKVSNEAFEGHVATDDKAVLARRAQHASAPHISTSTSLDELPIAPVWYEEYPVTRNNYENIVPPQSNDAYTHPSPSPQITVHRASDGCSVFENENPTNAPSAPPIEDGMGGAPSAPPMEDFSVEGTVIPLHYRNTCNITSLPLYEP